MVVRELRLVSASGTLHKWGLLASVAAVFLLSLTCLVFSLLIRFVW